MGKISDAGHQDDGIGEEHLKAARGGKKRYWWCLGRAIRFTQRTSGSKVTERGGWWLVFENTLT